MFYPIIVSHNFDNRFGQIFCISRSTDLIVYHIDLRPLFCQAQNGFHKIMTEGGVKPGGTNNNIKTTGTDDRLFSGQFGLTVHTDRTSLYFLCIRCRCGTVEYIIRRDMNQQTIFLLCRLCQIRYGLGINFSSWPGFVFSPVYSRISRTVDNRIHFMYLDKLFDRRIIGNIQFGNICKKHFIQRGKTDLSQLRTQLSVSPCNQYIRHKL